MSWVFDGSPPPTHPDGAYTMYTKMLKENEEIIHRLRAENKSLKEELHAIDASTIKRLNKQLIICKTVIGQLQQEIIALKNKK